MVVKKPYLEEENTVGTSGRPADSNEEEIDDVEDENEEIHEEDLEDEEEEEEVSPMQIPNPFLGLSPQSITNAALALAAQAQNPLKAGNGTDLDEERKQRQQLLMGGELKKKCEIANFQFFIFLSRQKNSTKSQTFNFDLFVSREKFHENRDLSNISLLFVSRKKNI